MIKDQFIYLYARNNQRFGYDIKAQAFSTCYPAKRTLINAICCGQWQEWQTIDVYLYPANIAGLRGELLAREGKSEYKVNYW